MRHEGTVKVKRRSREASGDIADCGFRPGAAYSPEGLRIADLTAKNRARPVAAKGMEPSRFRIGRFHKQEKILQRKVAKAQRRKAAKHFCILLSQFLLFSLRLCAFAPLRLKKRVHRGLLLYDAAATTLFRPFLCIYMTNWSKSL
jgi:hypothetical protein